MYDFHLSEVDSLLPALSAPGRPLKRRCTLPVPSKITEKRRDGKDTVAKRCCVCNSRCIHKRVVWQCMECKGHPGLCVPVQTTFPKCACKLLARLEPRMMPESRYFPPPSFSLGMHHYDDNLDFFSHKQHLIKVEPEVSSRKPTSKSTVSFYNCTDVTEGNSNSSSDHGSPEDLKKSSLILPDVEPSAEKNEMTYLKSKMAQACKICGKVLSSASSYYVHMKQHSGNKPFQCPVCEASFCRKPYLEVHMRTHTGERPFQCSLCLKRFTQKSSLNTHKRVHTGERPYSCDICHKRFAVKSYVNAHRWSHVADKPLQCEHCSQTFTSKAQYTIHARSHTPSHEFECHLCGRSFVKDSFLIRHHHRVHRDMFPPSNDYEHIAFDMRMKTKPSNSSTEINKQENTESA